ncbi:hypothetical protein LWI29_008710 [Acer saccharum]|uniref:Uncharacterized protein n=1 Tax=Acer saccharum TaxID=4024 RepID=A0AA39T214_ACESA|nr:hypothetical protein LWI29_008710 [Acer saccharum]
MLVNKNVDSSNEANAAISLVGNVGLSPEDFVKLRLLCLLLSGVIQIVALRPNLQMYLNEAVLSWPSMSSVVLMLSSDNALLEPKKPGFLMDRKPQLEPDSSNKPKFTSSNEDHHHPSLTNPTPSLPHNLETPCRRPFEPNTQTQTLAATTTTLTPNPPKSHKSQPYNTDLLLPVARSPLVADLFSFFLSLFSLFFSFDRGVVAAAVRVKGWVFHDRGGGCGYVRTR